MRDRPGQSESLLVRTFRLLLRCFPQDVRREFGGEMEELLIDLYRAERRRRGTLGAMWVVFLAYAEIPLRAGVAHREEWRGARRERKREGRSSRRRLRGGPGGIRLGLDNLLQDLRYAVRRLAMSPGFTAVAVISLTVGIGANTAIFSVVNAVFIHNRPYQDTEELVHVYTSSENGVRYGGSSYPDLLELRTLDDLFTEVGAFTGRLSRTRESGEARPVHVEGVTHNLFSLLGIQAAVGRTFLPEEDAVPGARAVAILNWGYWQRRYGGDPAVLGEAVEIAGRPYTIVGVTPERIESLLAPGVRSDLFVPMMMVATLSGEGDQELYADRGDRRVKIVGRLRDEIPLEQARSGVEGLSTRLKVAYPELHRYRSFNVVPLEDVAVQPDVDDALAYIGAMLMTTVGLVLLLACTNLATLLLARGVDRRREIAIRLALGVRRSRLVAQLLMETLVLVLFGTGAGLVLAQWSLEILSRALPSTYLSVMVDYGLITLSHGLDRTVLLYTLGLATLAGVLASLVPALQSTNPDVAPTLKAEAVPGSPPRHGLQTGLVGAQVAICLVLLMCGGLFLRSLQFAGGIDPGFETREAGMVWVDLQASGIPPSRWHTVTEELIERARSYPGIDAIGASNSVPLTAGGWSAAFTIPGVDPPEGWSSHMQIFNSIDPGFFDVMGIPLIAGRGITSHDEERTEHVVVVNEAAARRFWPDEEPLGQKIIAVQSGLSHRVVGVVGDTRLERLGASAECLLYFSHAQIPTSNVRLVATGGLTPLEIAVALQQAVQEVDENLVIVAVTTLDEQLSVLLFPARLAAGLLCVFGLLALGLACIGVYGVVSFTVSRRTREVVIRMSLGAEARDVVRMAVRSAMGMVLAGVAVGLAATLVLSRLLDRFLIGIDPYDLVTFTAVPLLLCAVALLASWVPARRAALESPVRALKYR
ncbi:ABC transporter permease [Gemmatimonadota bacterium]